MRPRAFSPCGPTGNHLFNILCNLPSCFRILHPFHKFRPSPLQGPGRIDGDHHGHGRRIGEHIVAYVDASFSGLFLHFQGFLDLIPMLPSHGLVVGPMNSASRFFSNSNELPFSEKIGLARPSDMAGYESIILPNDFSHFYELSRIRIHARRIDQPHGHTKGSLFEGLCETFFHHF